MKIVCDTDILSTFARIRRLDIMRKLFDGIVITQSVTSELKRGRINLSGLHVHTVKLSQEELQALGKADSRLGKGERECFVVAKSRHLPIASNEKLVQAICAKEGVGYFSLTRILRHAIRKRVVSRQKAREIVRLIQIEENTIIKNKEEIFK